MQWTVTVAIANAEDLFEVAKLLEPIAKIDGIKVAGATPRPEPKPLPIVPPHLRSAEPIKMGPGGVPKPQ